MMAAFLNGRFSAFLVSMVLLFLVSPLVPGEGAFFEKLFSVLMLVALVSCLKAISQSRKFFIGMVVFTMINLLIGSVEIFSDSEPEFIAALTLFIRSVYFLVVFFSIMRYVLDRSAVTADKICGAISAYLIMGLLWAFIYALFLNLDPECFRFPEGSVADVSGSHIWLMMYFSLTTLSSLGYGDIAPVSPGVQSYAVMEAVCGQIFLAVIVARLIALHITHESDEEKS